MNDKDAIDAAFAAWREATADARPPASMPGRWIAAAEAPSTRLAEALATQARPALVLAAAAAVLLSVAAAGSARALAEAVADYAIAGSP
jgi:hypothetical protein